jgi:hypothetical protein
MEQQPPVGSGAGTDTLQAAGLVPSAQLHVAKA